MKRADCWLLVMLAVVGATGLALSRQFPPPRGSGLGISLPAADLALKIAFSLLFGLLLPRAYPWRRRVAMALPFAAVWFVMTAGAAHLPPAWLGEAYVLAAVVIVGAFVVNAVWRKGDKRRGQACGDGGPSALRWPGAAEQTARPPRPPGE